MACAADAATRLVAIDVPSPFSLHYAGRAPGPARPFGFSMRKFAKEAESLPITSPEHVTALTQVRAPSGAPPDPLRTTSMCPSKHPPIPPQLQAGWQTRDACPRRFAAPRVSPTAARALATIAGRWVATCSHLAAAGGPGARQPQRPTVLGMHVWDACLG
eukprot:1179520-Prorocentrum_minimum.AAC.3